MAPRFSLSTPGRNPRVRGDPQPRRVLMATCNQQQPPLLSLELPNEFEDLSGLIQTDLKVIVSALGERANDRLLLTRRETQQLRRSLWNNLSRAINESVEPLSADRR